MKIAHGTALASIALALAACQGNFGGSGTSVPGNVTPPVNAQSANGTGQPGTSPSPNASQSPPASSSQTAVYPFAQAASGLQCPQSDGFSCVLHLNEPAATPTPQAHGKAKATPTPSPTPTPTPTPSPSGSPSPSPSPTPKPANLSLALTALPKSDVPPMTHPDSKTLATIALVALRVTSDADAIVEGRASADFTLPKEQIGGRGFAVQLYRETKTKKKHSFSFVGSYDKSKIDKATLRFEFAVPKVEIKKGETWLFVLYGDDRAASSASPGPSESPDTSPIPTSTP